MAPSIREKAGGDLKPALGLSGAAMFLYRILAGASAGGNRAGIGKLGTHTFRHTYRSWLDAVGTPIAVQQKQAAFGHPHNLEHLRRRSDTRNGGRQFQSCRARVREVSLTACKRIADFP